VIPLEGVALGRDAPELPLCGAGSGNPTRAVPPPVMLSTWRLTRPRFRRRTIGADPHAGSVRYSRRPVGVQRKRVSLWVASLAAGLTAWIESFQPGHLWPVAVASWIVSLSMVFFSARVGRDLP
jgi:hypothetical protein